MLFKFLSTADTGANVLSTTCIRFTIKQCFTKMLNKSAYWLLSMWESTKIKKKLKQFSKQSFTHLKLTWDLYPIRCSSCLGIKCQVKKRPQSKPPTLKVLTSAWEAWRSYPNVSSSIRSIIGTTTVVLFSLIRASSGGNQSIMALKIKF